MKTSLARIPIWSLKTFVGFSLIFSTACQKADDTPPPQAGYPSQPAPATAPVQQAPGYIGGASAQTIAAGASPAPASKLSEPGPLALPCQSDVQCLTHHCNVTAGKCAWPCQTDNDCMPGNHCVAPTCLPKLE